MRCTKTGLRKALQIALLHRHRILCNLDLLTPHLAELTSGRSHWYAGARSLLQEPRLRSERGTHSCRRDRISPRLVSMAGASENRGSRDGAVRVVIARRPTYFPWVFYEVPEVFCRSPNDPGREQSVPTPNPAVFAFG
jgi:hypothetical protein